jgi:Ca2+-binding RTX toxin-like protein
MNEQMTGAACAGARRLARKCAVELLEMRVLRAAVAFANGAHGATTGSGAQEGPLYLSVVPQDVAWARLEGGTLSIEGTSSSDVIGLRRKGATFEVTRSKVTAYFSYSTIRRIQVAAESGNDKVIVEAGVMGVSISGGNGNDTLDGGGGNDTLFGGSGRDMLNGGSGDDYLDGGREDDTAFGGSGDDAILGGEGNDHLEGGAGSDRILGGPGNDLVLGRDGNDALNGGDGNDVLDGEFGKDRLYGGSGDDWLIDQDFIFTDFDELPRPDDIFHDRRLLATGLVDGGLGRDTVIANKFDVLIDTEVKEG